MIMVRKINYLGLTLEKGKHKLQQHVLDHIQNFPDKIEDKKQLQRFLGYLTHAESYIKRLADVRKPLQLKLKKVAWNLSDQDSNCMKLR